MNKLIKMVNYTAVKFIFPHSKNRETTVRGVDCEMGGGGGQTVFNLHLVKVGEATPSGGAMV